MTDPTPTRTSATYQDFRDIYGPPTIVFNIPHGHAYHWYPAKDSERPYVIMTEKRDVRTVVEKMARSSPVTTE